MQDVAEWSAPADADVVLSNAVLQWVPSHRALLDRWAERLPPGGWLAVQVPGNFGAPSHVIMRHSTHMASQQMLAQAPLSILGGMMGSGVGAQLAQLGRRR